MSRGRPVERVQTGVRIEKGILQVLKALAEYLELSLGDLIEGIVLHAFENKAPFHEATLAKIRQLCDVYEMEFTALDSHHLDDEP